MRSAAVLTIIGGALPLALGATLGSLDGNHHSHSWAYPVPVWAFVTMSVGLALSHWLVTSGYLSTMRSGTGPAVARFAWIALVGTVAVGGCELWSAALARSDKNGTAADALNVGYGISSVLIVAGSCGSGWLLLRTWRRVALPLLVGSALLLVAVVLLAVGSDNAQLVALTVWSLSYVWLGAGLRHVPAPDPLRAPRRYEHSKLT